MVAICCHGLKLQDFVPTSAAGKRPRGRSCCWFVDFVVGLLPSDLCFGSYNPALMGHILAETSGLNLTGEFVGQTKKKVEEQLDVSRCTDLAEQLPKHIQARRCTSKHVQTCNFRSLKHPPIKTSDKKFL